jgi:hypothetical protein
MGFQMKWMLLKIFAVVVLCLLCASTALANFRITPTLTLRQEYNDNIFLTRDNKESDFISTIRPGFNLTWDTRPVTLSLDYSLRFRYYWKNTDQNQDSLRQTQRARLAADFSLYRDILFLSISDVYERVTIDEGERGGVDNDLINLTDSNRLRVNPYMILQPWRTVTFRTDYVYENVWYERDIAVDYERHTGRATLSKEISPRVHASLMGSHSLYRPKANPQAAITDADQEFDRTDARLSLTWAPTQRLHFDTYYGKAWIDYEERASQELDLYGAGFRYLLGPEKTVGARYDITTSFSVRDGLVENKRYSAFIEFTPRVTSRWTVFYSESDYLIQDRSDDSRGVILDGEWPWTDRMGLTYLVRFTRYERSGPGTFQEEYDRYGTRLGLYRDMRLGRFHVGHTWNKNDSDIPIRNYTNHIVWVEMRFVF